MTGGDMEPSKYTHIEGGLGELATSAASAHPQWERSSAWGGGTSAGTVSQYPSGALVPIMAP